MADSSEVAVLAGAQAKFALFLASLLNRAGVAPMEEFADLLGVFADSVADSDPGEAAILRSWVAAIQAMRD